MNFINFINFQTFNFINLQLYKLLTLQTFTCFPLRPSRLKKNLTRQVRQEPPMTKISNYSISIISYDSEQYLIKLFNVNEEY